MCARFTLSKELAELGKLIDFVCRVARFTPRYNIAPRQSAPVIVREKDLTVAKLMRWGLVPSWATDEGIGDTLINARAEALLEQSGFSKLMATQRCLIPADGYYEWPDGRPPVLARGDARSTGKTPFRFTLKDGGLFCFAGLWDKWISRPQTPGRPAGNGDDAPQPGSILETFAILTTAPNELAAQIQDRMPVILAPEHYGWWLYEDGKEEDLKSLLAPYPAEHMKCYRVSRLVNNTRNDSPKCIQPG